MKNKYIIRLTREFSLNVVLITPTLLLIGQCGIVINFLSISLTSLIIYPTVITILDYLETNTKGE